MGYILWGRGKVLAAQRHTYQITHPCYKGPRCRRVIVGSPPRFLQRLPSESTGFFGVIVKLTTNLPIVCTARVYSFTTYMGIFFPFLFPPFFGGGNKREEYLILLRSGSALNTATKRYTDIYSIHLLSSTYAYATSV